MGRGGRSAQELQVHQVREGRRRQFASACGRVLEGRRARMGFVAQIRRLRASDGTFWFFALRDSGKQH